MAGKGGGAWKVAYADFVTAMMAFFLVMWITAQSNAVKQAVARYFEHPFDAPVARRCQPTAKPVRRSCRCTAIWTEIRRIRPAKVKRHSAAECRQIMRPPPITANQPKSGGLRRRSGFMLREDDPSGMGNEIIFAGDSSQLDDRASNPR